jgi:hypothetical protein
MKKIVIYSFVVFFSTLLLCIVPIISLLSNIILLWIVEKIDFLGISLDSAMVYWKFAFGMLLFFFPAFIAAISIEIIIFKLLKEKIYKKVKSILDAIISFFLVLGYLYLLDKCIKGLSISLYGYLVLAFVYCMIFDLIENNNFHYRRRERR